MKKLSIVVPAYNEEEVLEIFYKETREVLESIKDKYSYEMILIDDGSTDKTFEVLKNLQAKDNNIHIISFSRNFGKEARNICRSFKFNRRFSSCYGLRPPA